MRCSTFGPPSLFGQRSGPEVFVVGGGVSKAGHFLVEGIQKYYDKYVFPPIKGAKILLAELGNEAGVYGAAKLALGD